MALGFVRESPKGGERRSANRALYPLLTDFAKKCQSLSKQSGPLAKTPGAIGAGPDPMVLDMLANGDRKLGRFPNVDAPIRRAADDSQAMLRSDRIAGD